MGNPLKIINDDHKCNLCNKIYACYDLKKQFCDHGYHSISGVFLCKECPNRFNFLDGSHC